MSNCPARLATLMSVESGPGRLSLSLWKTRDKRRKERRCVPWLICIEDSAARFSRGATGRRDNRNPDSFEALWMGNETGHWSAKGCTDRADKDRSCIVGGHWRSSPTVWSKINGRCRPSTTICYVQYLAIKCSFAAQHTFSSTRMCVRYWTP